MNATIPARQVKGFIGEETRMSVTRSRARGVEGEFRLIYFVAFTVFLIGITVSKLVPTLLRKDVSGLGEGKSIIAAARAAASRTVPFAFM